MNNKILLRVISLIMAVSVVLTVGGCKKKDSADGSDNKTKSAQVADGKGNPVQPDIEASTAVVKYTSVNSDGKKEDATTVISISSPIVNEATMGSKVSDSFKTDKDKSQFVDKAENGGIDKDKAEEIINNAEKWVEFGYSVYVVNTSEKRLCTRYIEIGGKNDNLVLSKDLDCEYSFGSGKGMILYVSGYVNIDKFPDEESLVEALNGMKVKLIYTLLEDSQTDVDDWSQVDIKKMDLKF